MDDGPNPALARFSPVRMALGLGVIGLLASTALAAPGDLVGGETAVFDAANDLPGWVGGPLELPMHLASSIGALVVVVAGFVARKRRVAAAGLLGWLAARLASTAMKAAVDRPRPSGLVTEVVLRQPLPSDGGFPSAHSAIAAALAVAAGWGWRPLRVPLALAAVAVGVARMYVGVHLPLDLVGGWALGVLCGLAAVWVVHPRVRPHPEPAPWSRRRPRKVPPP